MFALVQFGLAGVGLWWMCAKALPMGRAEIRRPHTFFMGVILFLQLPMAAGLGLAAGAAEGVKAARQGVDPDPKAVQKKYAWMDVGVSAAAVALAAGVGVLSARPRFDGRNLMDDEETVGVRDFVRERRQQLEADRRNQLGWDTTDDPDEEPDRGPARARRRR